MMDADAESESMAAMIACLTEGVWVGSQRLEIWDETPEDADPVAHIMSNLAIDCFDERGGYAVIRVCAHGTL